MGTVKAGNYGYINKIGKVVVKGRFSACADFSEGLAAVKTSIP
jgi:WG containing repeat